MNERTKQIAQGYRELADFIEANELAPVCNDQNIFLRGGDAREKLAALARQLPGPLEKRASGDYFYLRREFAGGVSLEINIAREQVCKKIVTEKVIPAEPERTVVIPARSERVEQVVSWECPDSLLRAQTDPQGREGEFITPCQGEPLGVGAATS